MTAEPWCWGVSHPLQLTTGLVIKSVTTSPTLAGERMFFIPKGSILSEQKRYFENAIAHYFSRHRVQFGFVFLVTD